MRGICAATAASDIARACAAQSLLRVRTLNHGRASRRASSLPSCRLRRRRAASRNIAAKVYRSWRYGGACCASLRNQRVCAMRFVRHVATWRLGGRHLAALYLSLSREQRLRFATTRTRFSMTPWPSAGIPRATPSARQNLSATAKRRRRIKSSLPRVRLVCLPRAWFRYLRCAYCDAFSSAGSRPSEQAGRGNIIERGKRWLPTRVAEGSATFACGTMTAAATLRSLVA